jgi:hypothetical protein
VFPLRSNDGQNQTTMAHGLSKGKCRLVLFPEETENSFSLTKNLPARGVDETLSDRHGLQPFSRFVHPLKGPALKVGRSCRLDFAYGELAKI